MISKGQHFCVRVPQKSVWVAGPKDRSTMRWSLSCKGHPQCGCQASPCIQPPGGERQTAQEEGGVWRSRAGARGARALQMAGEAQGEMRCVSSTSKPQSGPCMRLSSTGSWSRRRGQRLCRRTGSGVTDAPKATLL